jgi:hypothetical protein
MGAATDIANGFAAIISGAGVGVTFNTSGVYQPTDTGIVMKSVPALPNRIVVLTVVPLTDELAAPSGQVMVQVRLRGLPNAPLDVDDLGDAIKPFLHGLKNVTMGSVFVAQCNRQQSVPLGQDSATRWERADQYYLDVEYPPTPLVPAGGTY